MKKFAIFLTVGILVVAIVGFASFFYFDSTKDHSYDIISKCGPYTNCVLESLTNLSINEDRETVLTTFSGITTILKQRGHECHMFGHHLGFFLYDYTENLVEALSLIDRTCGGSIYHGVLQGYFTAKSLSDNGTPTPVVARNACVELSNVSYSNNRNQCAHGLGHGLLIAYNYDVFSAFEGCDVFEDDLGQRQCVAGVAMENAGLVSTPKGATLDEDDLLFPCSELDEKSAIPCLNYHSIYLLRTFDRSVEDAFEECEKNENETIVKYCYYGMGRIQFLWNADSLENAIAICQKGNLNYQNYCFTGSVYAILHETDANRGFEYCKLLPQMFKRDCYDALGKFIHTLNFTKEEIENACSQSENEEYYQVCVNADPEELGLV